jgi:acyl transferase domain-containing protein
MDKTKKDGTNKKVAVIGIGCRFPEANNWHEYWELLAAGKCAIRELPAARRNLAINQMQSNSFEKTIRGGYLDHIDLFDPLFFGITPREAARMEPQHRILLEVVWEAFEDAGIVVQNLAGSDTGVFIGTGFSGSYYFQHQVNHNTADIYSLSGAQSFAAANRISYLFDLQGPSFAVDSACSTSLIAVDEACARIQNGECTIAVAGGANILPFTHFTTIFDKARLLAPDGLCKAFDEKADGYVRGEGVGVVILKSLAKALEDKDSIYAVISGRALNHGGKNGRGFTYPNPAAQEAVLKAAYKNAGIEPEKVSYIETHGTGTPVGDEIELRGITNAVAAGRKSGEYCMIGAVKTNIGHLEYAAGIASFIKACLIVKEKQIPPSLHFQKFNGNVDFENMPVRVQTHLSKWPEDKELIAGLSSFGLGGANVHLVLEGVGDEPVQDDTPQGEEQAGTCLLPVTGKERNALKENALHYSNFIEQHQEITLQDICYSAGVRKDHFHHRLAIICNSKDDAVYKLKEFISGKCTDQDIFCGEKIPGKPLDVVFAFSDHNEGWSCNELQKLFRIPWFLKTLKEVDVIYYEVAQLSLLHVLHAKNAEDALQKRIVSDPFFFTFQVAMSRLWQRNGVSPKGLVGYGQGEIAAAYIAGLLTLEDSLKLIYNKGILFDSYSIPGKMINIMASLEELEARLSGQQQVYVSAINSSAVLTLSGANDEMEMIAGQLKAEGYFLKDLPRKSALYCPVMMDIRKKLSGIFQPAMGTMQIPIYFTTFGASGRYLDYTPAYWEEQLTGPIHFLGRIRSLSQNGCNHFIEIGDRSLLCFYITDILNDLHQEGIVISSLAKGKELEQCVLRGLGELYAAGYPLNWSNITEKGSFVKLPGYAWQKQSYWI